ncbi:MAG: acetylserotonin O-methyltransferase [Kiritimatiellaeota bacterium]|nr:acetylserotonin O-methyltransferase [Kiritimatiellota bacterium]
MNDWTMNSLMQLATGYWPAAALNAAVTLGVFEALPLSAGALAQRLATSPRHTRELLDALAGLGLLEKKSNAYAIAATAQKFLSPRGEACMLGALRYNADLYPVWGKLAETVRCGKPAVPPHAHLGGDPERTRRFALGMNSRALGLAPSLLPALEIPDHTTLLDVACGAGTFSRLLAERLPGLRVTQFDLPPVLGVAGELAQGNPRVSFAPGDYHADPLPGPFDTILYCGALHQETPEAAVALFRKIRASLTPGGRAVVVDLMTDASAVNPVFARLFSINMMLTNEGGRVYALDEVEGLLREAGFAAVSPRLLGDIPYGVVSASPVILA